MSDEEDFEPRLGRMRARGKARGRKYLHRVLAAANLAGTAMTLAADEFIRRFLLHALPRGFHRIRHYGLLASARRKDHLERARRLHNVTPAPAEDPPAELDAQPLCPCCGGTMIIIEVFERRYQPRAPPKTALPSGMQAP